MPQMAPLSWMTLFLLFTLIYSMTFSKVYFSNFSMKNNYKLNIKSKNNKLIMWKW